MDKIAFFVEMLQIKQNLLRNRLDNRPWNSPPLIPLDQRKDVFSERFENDAGVLRQDQRAEMSQERRRGVFCLGGGDWMQLDALTAGLSSFRHTRQRTANAEDTSRWYGHAFQNLSPPTTVLLCCSMHPYASINIGRRVISFLGMCVRTMLVCCCSCCSCSSPSLCLQLQALHQTRMTTSSKPATAFVKFRCSWNLRSRQRSLSVKSNS